MDISDFFLLEKTYTTLEEAVGSTDAAVRNEIEETNNAAIQIKEIKKPVGQMLKNNFSKVVPEAKPTKDLKKLLLSP